MDLAFRQVDPIYQEKEISENRDHECKASSRHADVKGRQGAHRARDCRGSEPSQSVHNRYSRTHLLLPETLCAASSEVSLCWPLPHQVSMAGRKQTGEWRSVDSSLRLASQDRRGLPAVYIFPRKTWPAHGTDCWNQRHREGRLYRLQNS